MTDIFRLKARVAILPNDGRPFLFATLDKTSGDFNYIWSGSCQDLAALMKLSDHFMWQEAAKVLVPKVAAPVITPVIPPENAQVDEDYERGTAR